MSGQDTYTFGECTWYVASTLPWVQGGWGNATDWPPNAARAGFQLTGVVTLGAVVAYAAGDGYSDFGHVAIVVRVDGPAVFLVSEMNFVGWDLVDQRVSNMHDVEAFILPPGVAPGSGSGSPGGGGAGTADAARVEWAGLQGYLNAGVETHLAWLRTLQARMDAL